MQVKQQIILNGKNLDGEAVEFYTKNRAFLYGDSIFETLRVNNRDILFFEEHLQRLILGMKVLKYEIPKIFTVQKHYLKDYIIQLLNRNKIFKSSRVRITVFRKTGGLYTPDTNEVDFVISASQIKEDSFVLNDKGLYIGVFEDVKKPINIFSKYKTSNSLLFTLAAIYKKENSFDDCLILNEIGTIAEAISSNIFLVIGNKLVFPPLSDACIDGIMRNEIIKIAKINDIVCEERSISDKDLFIASEVFFTNSISGIQWVVAYKQKRFYKKMSVFFINELNQIVKN